MTAIGTSDLDVFPLALGGNTFGWTSDEAESHAVLDAFTAQGGNLIDTADGYSAWVPGNSGGESETVIGSWLAAGGRRDDVVIATKVSTHPDFRGLAPDTIRRAADASLERLGTDRIDLYYAHFDDESTPLEETVAAFEELRASGKIRHVGVSNYTADRLQEWLDIADREGFAKPVALQPHYNLVHREPFESELAPIAERYGIGVVPYYALASGFLTGKYRSEADLGQSPRGGGVKDYLTERNLALLDTLDGIADAHGTTVAAVSLAWLRVQRTVVAPIASARTVEQVAPLIEQARIELTADELEALTPAAVA